MSNGVRHALGVVAGLLLTPLIAAGLMYGVGSVSVELAQFYRAPWVGFGVLALTAIVLAFLLGSRISPVASLMGGLTFTAVGVVPLIELSGVPVLPDGLLPGTMGLGLRSLLYPGVLLLLGVTMLAVSAFPSRWRSSRPAVPLPPVPYGGPLPYPPGPPVPPGPGHLPNAPQGTLAPEDATRPMQRE